MSTNTPSTEPLIVRLTPVGAGPPAEIRFRRALKALRRCYGLRAHWLAKGEEPAPERFGDEQNGNLLRNIHEQ
ncbi:MAG TPA: hypothetical protein VIL86_03240 [Tepidisphaeraceae bacterium]